MEKEFDQIKYIAEYNKKNYDRLTLMVPKGLKDQWKEQAKAEGMSLTAWIIKKTERVEKRDEENLL